MPEGGAVAQQGAVPAGRGQPEQKPANLLWTIARMFFMWYLVKSFFGGKSPHTLPREEILVPKFQKGFAFDLTAFVSEQPVYDLKRQARSVSPALFSGSSKEPDHIRPDACGYALHLTICIVSRCRFVQLAAVEQLQNKAYFVPRNWLHDLLSWRLLQGLEQPGSGHMEGE